MNDVGDDLRILKLAELYEDAYERFVREAALRTVEDPGMRAKLLRLAPLDDPHGARIAAERRRIEARLGPADKPAVLVGTLLDVVEVERAARSFYLSALTQAHDPGLVKLFRELAREEETHVGIAEDVLGEAKAALPRASTSGLAPEELALLGNGEPLLREGVSDFGLMGLHPPASERPIERD